METTKKLEDLVKDLNGGGFPATSVKRAMEIARRLIKGHDYYIYKRWHDSEETVNGGTWMSRTSPEKWAPNKPIPYKYTKSDGWNVTPIPDWYSMVGLGGLDGTHCTIVRAGTATNVSGEWVYDTQVHEDVDIKGTPEWCFWPHIEALVGSACTIEDNGNIRLVTENDKLYVARRICSLENMIGGASKVDALDPDTMETLQLSRVCDFIKVVAENGKFGIGGISVNIGMSLSVEILSEDEMSEVHDNALLYRDDWRSGKDDLAGELSSISKDGIPVAMRFLDMVLSDINKSRTIVGYHHSVDAEDKSITIYIRMEEDIVVMFYLI